MFKKIIFQKKKIIFLHARGPDQLLVQLSWWGQPETLFLGQFYLLYLLMNPGKDDFCFIGWRSAVSSDCLVLLLWLQRN